MPLRKFRGADRPRPNGLGAMLAPGVAFRPATPLRSHPDPIRCCRRCAPRRPSRCRRRDVRTGRSSAPVRGRAASRSSEALRRAPGLRTRRHGCRRSARLPLGILPSTTHGLSSPRGSDFSSRTADGASGTAHTLVSVSGNRSSPASRSTRSQRSVRTSESRQLVSISNRIAATAKRVSEPSLAIWSRTTAASRIPPDPPPSSDDPSAHRPASRGATWHRACNTPGSSAS